MPSGWYESLGLIWVMIWTMLYIFLYILYYTLLYYIIFYLYYMLYYITLYNILYNIIILYYIILYSSWVLVAIAYRCFFNSIWVLLLFVLCVVLRLLASGLFCRTCVSMQVRYKRAVTRPFVRLSVRQQLTCERNSSYSFVPIVLKLHRCFGHSV